MSTLKADTIVASDGSSPVTLTKQNAAKVFVRFELVGTAAILDSLNISSLNDLATGSGRPNHTSNMSNANYALVGGAALGSAHAFSEHAAGGLNITNQHRVTARSDEGPTLDADMLCSTIHGDLA